MIDEEIPKELTASEKDLYELFKNLDEALPKPDLIAVSQETFEMVRELGWVKED